MRLSQKKLVKVFWFVSINKKEKLKEVLKEKNINHDSKNIHDALKKHKEKTKTTKKNINNKKEQKTKKISTLDLILYSLIPLIVIAIGFIIYLFLSNKEQKTVETIKIKKVVEVKKTEPVKQYIFENLPKSIQDKYILKSEYKQSIERIKKDLMDEKKPIEQKKDSLKLYNSLNNSDIVFQNSSNAKDLLKCYDMNDLKSDLSQNCQKNLKSFLDKYKDVKYYEIVGVVSPKEIPQNDINKISKYKDLIYSGLAQTRANEIAWFIRKIVGQKPIIRVINYPVLSKKNNKGAIVRIYN